MFKEKFKYYKSFDYSLNEPDLIDVDKIDDVSDFVVILEIYDSFKLLFIIVTISTI